MDAPRERASGKKHSCGFCSKQDTQVYKCQGCGKIACIPYYKDKGGTHWPN